MIALCNNINEFQKKPDVKGYILFYSINEVPELAKLIYGGKKAKNETTQDSGPSRDQKWLW